MAGKMYILMKDERRPCCGLKIGTESGYSIPKRMMECDACEYEQQIVKRDIPDRFKTIFSVHIVPQGQQKDDKGRAGRAVNQQDNAVHERRIRCGGK